MHKTLIRHALLGAICGVLLGCGDTDADGGAEAGTEVCAIAECPAHCASLSVDSCDVREPQCQQVVFDSVLCVHGGSGDVPTTRVVSQADFLARMDASEEEPTQEELDQNVAWESGIQLLRLLDPEVTHESAGEETLGERVIGLYEPDTEEVLVVDRGVALEGALPMLTLAHEYVHALQDREVDLSELYTTAASTDEYVTWGCLVEGEARLYEWLIAAFMFDLVLEDMDLAGLFEDDIKSARSYGLLSEAPLLNTIFGLRYGLGARFLHGAWLEGGNEAVHVQYAEHPTESVGWMAGWDAHQARGGPWAEALSCEPPGPSGFTPLGSDSWGALGWFAFIGQALATSPTLPGAAAWDQAMQWRGDRVSLYEDAAAGEVAVVWTVRLDGDAHAESFAASVEQAGGDFVAVVRGPEVHVLAAADPTLLPAWQADLEAACP